MWMKRALPCKEGPLIMGILNITPDSFSDGGKFFDPPVAVQHALQMVQEGADIIDVGGESSRPFSERVTTDEELKRIIPVIKEIRAQSDVIISVDTYKAKVAREAYDAGADMVNDISALTYDPDMADTIASLEVYVVLMHIKGTPEDMQKDPHYEDVVSEIKEFLRIQTAFAISHGIREQAIIVDPGIGFGKRVEDNLRIIKDLEKFKDLGRPLLIGTSMKSFIGKITEWPMEERLEGTLASIAISLWNGADIVRVHDVKKTRKVVSLVNAIIKS
ncbi:MAG: dihydropteroate synthase [Syntrophus sp. (in: bacteria)]|nr:dihydropteroate synthase [Syntrophus sp. (in: bacteria)]